MIDRRNLPHVLTAAEAAELLECEESTVEEACRDGELPAIKVGRPWILPTAALLDRLNQLAVAQAVDRIKAREEGQKPAAVVQLRPGRERRVPPQLPELQ